MKDPDLEWINEVWAWIPKWWRVQIMKLVRLALMKEVWEDIIVDTTHRISNVGRYKNKRTGKILFPAARLRTKGSDSIGALMLEAFVEPRPKEKIVRYLDGDCWLGNYIGNVVWGTRSENALDSMKHGTWVNPNKKGSK